MVFTKEDARDDATVKSEVRGDLIRVAKNQSPQIYEHFERVCHELNQDPGDVLADMLVRAINSQEYADKIAAQQVSMEVLQTGEFRKEDIELVKSLADEFDLTPDEEKESIVDKIIEDRISAVSTSPFEDFSEKSREKRQADGRQVQQLEREVQRLQSELERVKGDEVEETTSEPEDTGTVTESSSEEKKDLDDLFGGGSDEEEAEEEETNSDDEDEEPTISVDVTEADDEPDGEDEEEEDNTPDIDIEKSASHEETIEDAFDE